MDPLAGFVSVWLTFAGVIGGASAGLIGLTFIVTSIRFDTIAASQELRNRTAQTLSMFVAVLVLAIVVAIPQPETALGIEVVALSLASAGALTVLDHAARSSQPTRPGGALLGATASFVGLLAASGLLILFDLPWGRYLYAAAAVVGLVWGVVAAWVFLTRAGTPARHVPAAAAADTSAA